MATEKQIEANRKNAQKSTGPKTEEGKMSSRRNALKHGLAAVELLPEQDQAAANARAASWGLCLGVSSETEVYFVKRMAAESIRVERCTRQDSQIRSSQGLRAEVCWDQDRMAAADKLGKTLHKDPLGVRLELMMTLQGCLWLAARLQAWAAAVGSSKPDGVQLARVLDLLGVPIDERVGIEGLVGVESIRAEVSQLAARGDRMKPSDDAERDMAEVGMGEDVGGELRRLRRYESGCSRRLEWAHTQLKKLKSGQAVDLQPPSRVKPPPPPQEPAAPSPPLATNPNPTSAPLPTNPNPSPVPLATKPNPAPAPPQKGVNPAVSTLTRLFLKQQFQKNAPANRRERRAMRSLG